MTLNSHCVAELIRPSAQVKRGVKTHERGVGWIGDAGMGELAMKEGVEMAAQIGLFHHGTLVLQKPGPGGGGNAAGDWAISGELQMALFSNFFFQFAGDF